MQVKVIGYKPFIKNCFPSKYESAVPFKFSLEPTIIEMPSIQVEEESYQTTLLGEVRGYSTKRVTSTQALCSVGAMEDVVRYFTKLPSVQQRTDLNSLLYIRGGSPDQNLVLIDDVPIYNPYAMRLSMGGAISIINSDLLKSAELLDDGFGARYGNRLSSVLNVKYREGSKENFKWNSNLNVTSARLSIEGPVFGGKGSYIASFGQTYLDYILNSMNDPNLNIIVPNRKQAHGKLVYNFSPGNKLCILAIGEQEKTGMQHYGPENMNLESTSGTQLISARQDIVLSPKLYATTILSFYGDDNNLEFFDASNVFYGGRLSFSSFSRNFREELNWQPSSVFSAVLGTEITSGKEYLNWYLNWRSAVSLPFSTNFKNVEQQVALYLENNLKFSSQTSLTVGLRRDISKNFKSAIYSPRMRFQASLNQKINFSVSWGTYHQYPGMYSAVLKGIPLDISTNYKSLAPEKAYYLDYGTQLLLFKKLVFETHSYYRKLFNILSPDERLIYKAGNSGTGYAKGIELHLRNLQPLMKRFSLYFAYAWAKASYRTDDSKWTFFNHDRRHSFSCSFKWDISKYFSTELYWRFGTGFPYTPIVDVYYAPYFWQAGPSGWCFVKGEKNSERFPSYHKLDMRFSYASKIANTKIAIYLEFANVYNRKNVYIYDWNVGYQGNTENPSLVRTAIYMMPFIPMIGIRLGE